MPTKRCRPIRLLARSLAFAPEKEKCQFGRVTIKKYEEYFLYRTVARSHSLLPGGPSFRGFFTRRFAFRSMRDKNLMGMCVLETSRR